eukprot:scaffold36298_cov122-Isochrysis_galbana.AAC.20
MRNTVASVQPRMYRPLAAAFALANARAPKKTKAEPGAGGNPARRRSNTRCLSTTNSTTSSRRCPAGGIAPRRGGIPLRNIAVLFFVEPAGPQMLASLAAYKFDCSAGCLPCRVVDGKCHRGVQVLFPCSR